MQNRLDELKLASAEVSPANKKEASVEMVKIDVDDNIDETVAAFQGIMSGIQKIEKNIETINTLKQRPAILFWRVFVFQLFVAVFALHGLTEMISGAQFRCLGLGKR